MSAKANNGPSTVEERLATLEAEMEEGIRQRSDLFNKYNGIRDCVDKRCTNQRKECGSKMDKISEDVVELVEKSWLRMMLIMKIFIPVCVSLFFFIAGWSLSIQSQMVQTANDVKMLQQQAQDTQQVNIRILNTLSKIDSKLDSE